MIKYLGSKRKLIPQIVEAVEEAMPKAERICDLFSGTSRVGYALKQSGYDVVANDHNLYAFTLAKCYVETDLEDVESKAKNLIRELNRLSGKQGYFTDSFCLDARFFHPKNGERVDAIREEIEKKDLPPNLKAVMLVSLMEAADRVDSTCGLQMAYLKNWAKRANNELELKLPALVSKKTSGSGEALCLDAVEASRDIVCDLTYLDPPYNQHSYRSNYHIWETLVRWDKPEKYGKANKRVDCKTEKSLFNMKKQFLSVFSQVIQNIQSKVLIVSFNNEGFISRKDMEDLLAKKGEVKTKTIDYKRYVGAQIGIHNLKGKAVGEVSHLYNQEYLYTVHVG